MSGAVRPASTLWHVLLKTLRMTPTATAPAGWQAVLSPQQSIRWTYEDLESKARGLSIGLMDRGVGMGDAVATDLPNVAEGLVLHLACSRLGAAVVTAKKSDVIQKIPNVKCAVVAASSTGGSDTSSWLTDESLSAPPIFADQNEMQTMMDIATGEADSILDDDKDEHAIHRPLGYFGSPTALTHGTAVNLGIEMVNFFDMIDQDRVCVSITLYHAFGIGSACCSVLQSGGAIVLPAVGGLQGCGVPSQRARVTLQTLVSQKCTLLFADTHTIEALNEDSLSKELADANLNSHLRGGMCKTGSGSTILDETVDLSGVTLAALGKKT